MGRNPDDSPFQGLQRDTLYVSGSGTASNSEWIVSYNISTGPEARMTNGPNNGDEISSLESTISRVRERIDLRLQTESSIDPFLLAKYIVSRMVSYGHETRVIAFLARADATLTALVYSILVASNVVKLSVHVDKFVEDFRDVLSVSVLSGKDIVSEDCMVSKVSDKLEGSVDFRSYQVTLIKEIFDTIIRHPSNAHSSLLLQVRNENLIVPTLKSIAVLETEIKKSSLSSHLVIDIQPGPFAVDTITICMHISRVNGPFDEGGTTIAVPIETVFGGHRSMEISVNPSKLLLINFTNTLIRIFMGGYAEITIQCDDEQDEVFDNKDMTESLLIVSKYFDYSLSRTGPGELLLVRKSKSIDTAQSVAEEKSMLDLVDPITTISSIITTLNKQSSAWIEIEWSVSWSARLHDLLRILKEARFEFPRSCSVGYLKISGPITSFEKALHECIQAGHDDSMSRGDVSPNNFKVTDCQIRFGSDKEIDEFEAGLDEMDYKSDFSVLLVGPRNIGLGVRLLATAGLGYEFISERAVRDVENNTLKCAVRLFISRDEQSPKVSDILKQGPLIIDILENDSRITIANQLFTGLNSAPANCKYVLMKAKGDHCTFVGAMGVVVANGWSRSIHQRVETRVTIQSDTVLYITRLIPSVGAQNFSQ